jgi:DNA-binding FrmR family transcriptional regulator
MNQFESRAHETSTDETLDDGRLHDADAVRKITNRLKRAQGQLAAVISAVEGGGDCRAVVTQLAAVSSALDRAGFAIISTALRECISTEQADAEGSAPNRLTVTELEKLFLTLA